MSTSATPRRTSAGSGTPTPRRAAGTGPAWLRGTGPSWIALASWVLGSVLAVWLVGALDLNPMSLRGAVAPIAVGAVVLILLLAVTLPPRARAISDWLAGLGAGLYSAWIALVLLAALHGTPYGHYGLYNGDIVRLTALATRLSTTWRSADAFVQGLPSEYPPLFPWLVGRASQLLDRPAWTLMGGMEVVFISASVVVAFLLWRRLVRSPTSLALAVLAPAVFGQANKSYEIITLAVLVPWALATFAELPRREADGCRREMHWLPAGIIGGLFVLTYTGYLMFAAVGIVAVIAVRLLRRPRGRYLRHLLGVAVTAAVVSSWYIGPLLYAYLTMPRNVVSDTYPNADIAERPVPLPFLEPTVLGVLSLVGFAGLVWYRRREWWAGPILLLLMGTYAYWAYFISSTALNGHTGFLVKFPRVVGILLAVAGVLVLLRLADTARRRLHLAPPRSFGIAALALLLVVTGMDGWKQWTPGEPRGFATVEPPTSVTDPNPATFAHVEVPPSGEPTRFAPEKPARYIFPTQRIDHEVSDRLGEAAKPLTLSDDMRLFAYLPWYAYEQIGEYSANSLMRYTDRYHVLQRLSRVSDPTRFAQQSGNTPFGGIQVFVLRDRGETWNWHGLAFDPAAFSGGRFDVVADMPQPWVLVVRR